MIQNLSKSSFDDVLTCFLESFENYFVPMPTDSDYYRARWKSSRVDFNCSYGMFDQGKLVGFMIHAIDRREGLLTAFNTGTGVIPAYRGRRIVKAIYAYALKDLAKHGIERVKLEVITKNTVAIKAYEGIGFKINNTMKCFSGILKIKNGQNFELVEVDRKSFSWDALPHQSLYSWHNQRETLIEGDYRCFHVFHAGKLESFFVIKPNVGSLAQCDVLEEGIDIWMRLFEAVSRISPSIKINNVDHRLESKINMLRAVGLENTVDQYEMELAI